MHTFFITVPRIPAFGQRLAPRFCPPGPFGPRPASASCGGRSEHSKGGGQVLNPLAIGVTVGGLLLDVVVPRPKPRTGLASDELFSSRHAPIRGHQPGEVREARPSAGRGSAISLAARGR